MTDQTDDLASALTLDEGLVPSSHFADRVMEAVYEAAAEPPPLPFPWRPVIVGVLACAGLAASGVALLDQLDAAVLRQTWSELSAAGPELGYAAILAVLSIGLLRAHRIFTAF
jgi:hypothetical protein